MATGSADGPPLRVALVVERYGRMRGGVERVACDVAHGLAALGDDVHVIARAVEADAPRAPGVTLHRIERPTRGSPLRWLELSHAARRVVERERFDVVHGFARVLAQDLFHAGLGCHAAYLEAVHGPLGRAARRLSPRHVVKLQLEARIARSPGIRIQCPSTRVARDFRAHYAVPESRLCVVPNGVDLARFDAPQDPAADAALRASLAAGADAVWLFVGTGFRRKGLDTAIAALARSRVEHAVLWVVGRDRPEPWRRLAARCGVADRVRFLGERGDVPRLLSACDGLVLPTRYEPGGLVVLEAAAAGRPVVTSRACGHAELLEDAALVVADAADAAGFAAALDRLADAGLRAELGERGARRARAHGLEAMTRALRAEYRALAGRRETAG